MTTESEVVMTAITITIFKSRVGQNRWVVALIPRFEIARFRTKAEAVKFAKKALRVLYEPPDQNSDAQQALLALANAIKTSVEAKQTTKPQPGPPPATEQA